MGVREMGASVSMTRKVAGLITSFSKTPISQISDKISSPSYFS